MPGSSLPRRRFLQGAAAVTAGAGLGGTTLSARSFSRLLGSNEELRLGVIGLKGRGNGLMKAFHNASGARVVALCDVDQNVLDQRGGEMEKNGAACASYRDAREMLDSDAVDGIVIATPNHWHALLTVWGCMADKHVYCEKPVSHNVWEGRQAANAAVRYGKIVATGTQSRSSGGMKAAVDYVQSGALGAIRVSRGLCYKSRPSIGHVKGPTPIPPQVDFDLWTGPADLLPIRRKSLHYDWHWVWNTGNGDIGNQGIHQMDIARWFLGAKGLSKRCLSVGGRFGYVDDGETPNTQVAVHEFDEGVLVFEVRGLYKSNGNAAKEGYKGQKIGNVVECENGYVSLDTSKGKAYDWDGKELAKFDPKDYPQSNHQQNFVDAVQAGDPGMLRSDIEEGHVSSALCHLGNISHQLGSRSTIAELKSSVEATEAFAGTGARAALTESHGRFRAHLQERGLELDSVVPYLGMPLVLDSTTETFVDNPTADLLLSRNYREPFVVPRVDATRPTSRR